MESRDEEDGLYIRLVGSIAIHFDKAENVLEVYAYDPATKRIIRDTRLPFYDPAGDNDPWILFPQVLLVAELPRQDLSARLEQLEAGEPVLLAKQESEAALYAPFMTSEDPPKSSGTTQLRPLN